MLQLMIINHLGICHVLVALYNRIRGKQYIAFDRTGEESVRHSDVLSLRIRLNEKERKKILDCTSDTEPAPRSLRTSLM